MTKGRLLTLGAVVGAIIIAVFGFGIYGIISCSNKLFIERRIKDSHNDEYYESVVAQVAYIKGEDSDFPRVMLLSEKKDYDATILPETKKFLQSKGIELKSGESYVFTVFTAGEPTVHYAIAAIASEDGKEVYLAYEYGKQMITDYFISLQD